MENSPGLRPLRKMSVDCYQSVRVQWDVAAKALFHDTIVIFFAVE
jgi:hypothetical protein